MPVIVHISCIVQTIGLPRAAQERAKFVDYLKARLRLKSIDIVNVTSEINLRKLNSLQANDTVRKK